MKLDKFDSDQIEYNVKEPTYLETRSTTVTTNSKKLAIGKSCTTKVCTLMISNTWLAIPRVKSYDVMGANFYGTTLANQDVVTIFKSDSGNSYCTESEYVRASNGIGCSHKLDENSENFYSYQTFEVYTEGLVYASYQHSGKTISLANSKDYIFHINGYGNVFLFNNQKAKDAYDAMSGVDINT